MKKAYEFEVTNTDAKFKLGLTTAENDIRKVIGKVIKTPDEINKASKIRVKKILEKEYIEKWKSELISTSKARTYAVHKTSYKFEPYLELVKIRRHRIALSKLRLSDHILMIEVGRHRRPKLDVEQRLSNVCPEKIEDEAHFQVTCITHNYHRAFIDKVTHDNTTYTDMDELEKYSYIVNKNDPVHLASTAHTIYTLFNERVSN